MWRSSLTKPFIKICGITRREDLLSAVEGGSDAIGFIAYPKSPRYVSPQKVRELLKDCPPQIKKVVVVVNADLEVINEYLSVGIDVVQLHGSEDAAFAEEIKVETWKAIRLHEKSQIAAFADFPCQLFVVDSFVKDSQIPGGTGHSGDWALAAEFAKVAGAPVLLAGGIKKTNALEALEQVPCYGLDLSSGVEISPGIKSAVKIQEFFEVLNS